MNQTISKFQKQSNEAKCPDCDCELAFDPTWKKAKSLAVPAVDWELEVIKPAVDGGCVSLQETTIEGEDWGE